MDHDPEPHAVARQARLVDRLELFVDKMLSVNDAKNQLRPFPGRSSDQDSLGIVEVNGGAAVSLRRC